MDPATAQSEAPTLFASLEQYSEHPLGKAVVESARQAGVNLQEASSIEIHKGRGIVGEMDGRRVFAGNRRLVAELGIPIDNDSGKQASNGNPTAEQ